MVTTLRFLASRQTGRQVVEFLVHEAAAALGLRLVPPGRILELERERSEQVNGRLDDEIRHRQEVSALIKRAETAEGLLTNALGDVRRLELAAGTKARDVLEAVLVFTGGSSVDFTRGDKKGHDLTCKAYCAGLGMFEGEGRTVEAALVDLARTISQEGDRRGQGFTDRVQALRSATTKDAGELVAPVVARGL
jgi:hypothetical protein